MMETSQSLPANGGLCADSARGALERTVSAVAWVLIPVALYTLTRQYKGLTGDAELYAFQALARIHANLCSDLFLQNSVQDRLTVFSPLYAAVIRLLGLPGAALTLLIVFKACYFAAAFAVVKKIATPLAALVAVGLLMAAPGYYGAFHAFHFGEDMLTARTLAEALTMTALVLYVYERSSLAFVVSIAGLFVHALIALPVVLLFACLALPLRVAVACIAAGVALALGIAASALAPTTHLFTVVDPAWLEIVRERSQFLFLQLWKLDDWQINLRPFLSLALTWLVLEEPRLRKLCSVAMLVGAAGLLIAGIASTVGPVAILLQGQAWRWIWLTDVLALLLAAPSVFRLWRSDPCGPACACLLLMGWSFLADGATPCIAAALAIWLFRARVPAHLGPYVRLSGFGIALIIAALTVGNALTWGFGSLPESGRESPASQIIRGIARLDGMPIFLAWAAGYALLKVRSRWLPAALAAGCGALATLVAPGTFNAMVSEGTAAQIEEFADWRAAIPPQANTFVVPAYNSARFAWFTLQRPSYLTVDQSSGVIFSRSTALEVKRRSQVLLPIMAPDWQLLSRHSRTQPTSLTAERLVEICRDPLLNFVVAREQVGFDPVIHRQRGAWFNWALYDCNRVNSAVPAR
jgi:hypothetical protein